jgi:hypothetical protein
MFTNSDIVYSTELLNIYVQARDAVTEFPHGFSMIGRRKNVVLEEVDLYHDRARNPTSATRDSGSLRASSIVKSPTDKMFSTFGGNFEHIVQKATEKFSYSAPQGVDFFLMPQWGFPLNFPPLMIGRAQWDNRMLTSLIRNGNSAHPGPPAIHVTQSVTSIHMGAASDWGNYNDRKGADWMYFLGMNITMTPPGTSQFTQYYSRGFCNATESANSSDCNATDLSLDPSKALDFENKATGKEVHVTKSGFVFARRKL